MRFAATTVSSAPGVFLCDLVPEEVRLGFDSTLLNHPGVIGEIVSPHSLMAHPGNESSHFAYHLPGDHRFLVGKVGINDSVGPQPGHTSSPLTFRVAANGYDLWRSRPLQIRGESQKFRVDVSGVRKLDLFVDHSGNAGYGHATWIEPRLTNRPDDSQTLLSRVEPAAAPPKLEVLEARFGGGNNWADLTAPFRELAHGTSLIFTTHISHLNDPTPGWRKSFHLRYRLGNEERGQDWGEDQLVVLGAGSPPPDVEKTPGLVIGDAAYGAAYKFSDVTDLLRRRIRGSQLSVHVRGDLLGIQGDLVWGAPKLLYIHYWFNGQPRLAIYWDNDQFTIGQDQ